MSNPRWDREVDVVVVGSGAAALTAAIVASDGGLTTELLEKTESIGGATAVSGGGVWAPLNAHMGEVGVDDTREDAAAYIRACADARAPDPALIETYVDNACEAVGYLEQHTPLRFVASTVFSDYHLDRPGARPLGRTLDPTPFPSRDELGDWDERVRTGPHYPRLTLDEMAGAGEDGERVGGPTSAGIGPQALALASQRERAGVRTMGGAIVAALLRGALDRGVAVNTASRAVRLVIEDEAVVGVVVEHDGVETVVAADRGVILATGGFEWNPELVRAFLGVPEILPLSPPANFGDGLIMALRAGAAVANMTVAWAFPVTSPGVARYDGQPLHMVGTPRSEPGCITVNRHGRRFTNEGVAYMDFGRMHRVYDAVSGTYPNESPVWAIFDQRVRERVVLADLTPDAATPDWVHEEPTIADLADSIGVDRDGLCDEVRRFNGFAANGKDLDFGRGTVWYEGATCGGPSPARALGPIDTPPYYALNLHDGALGTAGGVRVDEHGRVLAASGSTVEGLYAAGNAAASVFGPGYPGGGATLGPAITFGYLAGRHLARATSRTATPSESQPVSR